jgi:hypothetical protein
MSNKEVINALERLSKEIDTMTDKQLKQFVEDYPLSLEEIEQYAELERSIIGDIK